MQISSGMSEDLVSALERLDRLLRSISVSGELSPAAAGTLSRVVREQPVRVSELARRERVTQPAMTQLLGRLERDGLVARSSDPDDLRAVLIRATDLGVDTWRRRHDERVAAFAQILGELDKPEIESLRTAIPALHLLADAGPLAGSAADPHVLVAKGGSK